MSLSPNSKFLRWRRAALLALAAGCADLTLPALAQSLMYGRTEVALPERSDAGNWQGTWYYSSRVQRMAMWMQDWEEGKPRLMLRMHAAQGIEGESFTTDWNGVAEYDYRGGHGSFRLEFEQADANTIAGRWVWETGRPSGGSRETAQFTIYRTGIGRDLVWHVRDLKSEAWGNGRPRPAAGAEMVWSFRKASRRHAMWSELAF